MAPPAASCRRGPLAPRVDKLPPRTPPPATPPVGWPSATRPAPRSPGPPTRGKAPMRAPFPQPLTRTLLLSLTGAWTPPVRPSLHPRSASLSARPGPRVGPIPFLPSRARPPELTAAILASPRGNPLPRSPALHLKTTPRPPGTLIPIPQPPPQFQFHAASCRQSRTSAPPRPRRTTETRAL